MEVQYWNYFLASALPHDCNESNEDQSGDEAGDANADRPSAQFQFNNEQVFFKGNGYVLQFIDKCKLANRKTNIARKEEFVVHNH